jgi:SnoaL-like domain
MGVEELSCEQTASHYAIQRLLATYADAVNRHAFKEFPALFLENARIELTPLNRPPIVLSGPEALGRFIEGAIARFDFFEFVLLNSRIELGQATKTARGRNFICEYRRERETGKWTQVFGVYHDRYLCTDGGWWFEQRSFDPLATAGADDVVFPVPARLEALFADPLAETPRGAT